jgi:hypothetical protein
MYSSHQLDPRSPAPPRRARRSIWVLGVLGLMVPGCLIDSDNKCGPNQELLEYAEESERCVCVAGTAFDAASASCKACGDNEMATAAGCQCVAGFARALPTDPCAELPPDGPMKPTGEDQPCTGPADCAGFEASFCDNIVSGTCLVPNCTLAPNDSCFTGKECCDLSSFGLSTLCIAAGACTT